MTWTLAAMAVTDWNGDGDTDCIVQPLYPWFCWMDGSYIKHGYAKAKILIVESIKK